MKEKVEIEEKTEGENEEDDEDGEDRSHPGKVMRDQNHC